MDAQNKLAALFDEIKKQTGLDLTLDEDGMAAVLHDSGAEIIITADYPSGLLRFNTILGQVRDADRATLFGDLLQINFLPQLYGPFFLSLNPAQDTVLLVGRASISSMTPDGMTALMSALTFAHGKLSQALDGAVAGQGKFTETFAALLGAPQKSEEASTQSAMPEDMVPPGSFA